jgi:hypothetical protein
MNTSPRTALSSTLAGLARKASFPSESTAPIDPVRVGRVAIVEYLKERLHECSGAGAPPGAGHNRHGGP